MLCSTWSLLSLSLSLLSFVCPPPQSSLSSSLLSLSFPMGIRKLAPVVVVVFEFLVDYLKIPKFRPPSTDVSAILRVLVNGMRSTV